MMNRIIPIAVFTFQEKYRSFIADFMFILALSTFLIIRRWAPSENASLLFYTTAYFTLIIISLGASFHHGFWTFGELYQHPDNRIFWSGLPIRWQIVLSGKLFAMLLRLLVLETILYLILILNFQPMTGYIKSFLFLPFLFIQSIIYMLLGVSLGRKFADIRALTFLEISLILPVLLLGGLIPILFKGSSILPLFKLLFPPAWIYTAWDYYLRNETFNISYLWIISFVILMGFVWFNFRKTAEYYK